LAGVATGQDAVCPSSGLAGDQKAALGKPRIVQQAIRFRVGLRSGLSVPIADDEAACSAQTAVALRQLVMLPIAKSQVMRIACWPLDSDTCLLVHVTHSTADVQVPARHCRSEAQGEAEKPLRLWDNSRFALHALHRAAADAQLVRNLQHANTGSEALPDGRFRRGGYLGPSDGLQPPALRVTAHLAGCLLSLGTL
jgi:hypothetical protein